jgi:hypothetical protein
MLKIDFVINLIFPLTKRKIFMKKFAIVLLTFFGMSTAYANFENNRLYVQPGSVYVAPNGIFLNIDGEFYGVTSLEVDENGIYIPAPIAGFCGKHGYYPGNATVCPYCAAEKKRRK